MITIENMRFGFNANKPLFNDLNLELNDGKIYGLLGRNGSGKTTLIKNILGLRFPQKGTISVMGSAPSKRNLDMLQESFLLPEEIYTPRTNIKSFIQTHSRFYPRFSSVEFYQLLNEFELPKNALLPKLSMGQKKKVLIAFALACNTKLLIMDEPTNGLDIPSKRQFRKILSHTITNNRLFLISTHQIRDLHSLIDTVLVLKNGRVVFHRDIIEIERVLDFTIEHTEPKESEYLYYERVPGGYFCINPSTGVESLEVDLEVLFNAITVHKDALLDHFNTSHKSQL